MSVEFSNCHCLCRIQNWEDTIESSLVMREEADSGVGFGVGKSTHAPLELPERMKRGTMLFLLFIPLSGKVQCLFLSSAMGFVDYSNS